jgi:hypothetical protein
MVVRGSTFLVLYKDVSIDGGSKVRLQGSTPIPEDLRSISLENCYRITPNFWH